MNRYFSLFLLFASTVVFAQDKPPALLFEAAQCLVTDTHHWVETENVKMLDLGYLPDHKTFAGSKYLYVIVYSSPKRDQGTFYDIRYKDESHHRLYSIENNATFTSTPKGITFSEPPLGGTWTQNQLTPAIQQILHHKKWYEVEMKYLLKPSSHLLCETNVEDVVNK